MIQRIKNCIKKHDDILSWKIWENIKTKFSSFGSFQLWTSLIFTVVFYMQLSSLSESSFLLSGDNLNLWMMQIYNTAFLNNDFIFKGIDFFTHGGSSEYFFRPNISTYNPIILFFSYFVDVDNIQCITKLIFSLFLFHSFFACYCTQRLCINFLKFDKYISLLAAVIFTFSYLLLAQFTMIPLFLIICLVPVVLYTALSCLKNFNATNIILSSFVLITLYTSGYVPLSIFAIAVSFVFCIFYLFLNKNLTIRNIFKILAPFIISGIIILPLYVNVLNFVHLSKPGETSLFFSALEHGTNPNLLLKLFFYDVNFSGKYWHGGIMATESQKVTVGIIPFIVLFLFIFRTKAKDLGKNDKALLYFCLIIFGFMFLAAMGIYSPFSYFMYEIPILGESRIYTRQLAIVSIFFFIAIAKLLEIVVDNKNLPLLKDVFMFLLVFLFFLLGASYLQLDLKSLKGGNVIMQIIMAELFLAILILSNNRKFIIICSTLIIFFVPLTEMYKLSINKMGENGLFSSSNYQARHDLKNYIENTANKKDKKIVKYIEFTPYPGYDSSYFNRNIPWMLRDNLNISSLSGYEARMSAEYNYKLTNRRIPWLSQSGADFVIWKKGYNFEYLSKYVDLDKSHQIKGIKNIFIAPLYFQDPQNTIFNNGYVRIISEDKEAKIINFDTNNANHISFETNSKEPLSAQYLFWPNKHMKPYVNGKKFEFERVEDLDVLNIPAGKSKVEIVYKNTILDIFLVLYFGFLAVFALFTLWRIALFGIRIKNKLIKS